MVYAVRKPPPSLPLDWGNHWLGLAPEYLIVDLLLVVQLQPAPLQLVSQYLHLLRLLQQPLLDAIKVC